MTDYTYVKDTGEVTEHQGLDSMMMKKDYYASMKHGMKSNHACTGWHSAMGVLTWLAFMALLVALARYFWKKAE